MPIRYLNASIFNRLVLHNEGMARRCSDPGSPSSSGFQFLDSWTLPTRPWHTYITVSACILADTVKHRAVVPGKNLDIPESSSSPGAVPGPGGPRVPLAPRAPTLSRYGRCVLRTPVASPVADLGDTFSKSRPLQAKPAWRPTFSKKYVEHWFGQSRE
jgi:hypothetical protein